MKKILLFIFGLFGIFGCCFGVEYTLNFLSGSYSLYDNIGFTTRETTFSFYDSSISTYSYCNHSPDCGFSFSLSGINSDVYLTNICLYSQNSDYTIFPLYSTTYHCSINGNYCCFDLGDSFNLSDYSYLLTGIILQSWRDSSRNQMGMFSSSPRISTSPYTSSIFPHSTYSISFFNLIPELPNLVFNFSGQGNPNRIALPISMTFRIPSNPKFKVNYGNTFYEYELSDNLEIYLKSPVVMSGTTDYIYSGSTGINLFFNGTSQFYNKSELYLNTPSWFNNNIFTPICL